MQNRDEFDGPGGLPDFRNIAGSIFRALDRRDHIGPRRPVWAAGVVGTLVVFLGAVLWFSYPRGGAEEAGQGAVPTIHADAGPYKVMPSEPGGMAIPNRDSTVFETLRASRELENGERYVENLLDDPEEPIDRDQFFAGLRTEVRVEGREVISAAAEAETETVAEEVTETAGASVTVAEAAPQVIDITEKPAAAEEKAEPVAAEPAKVATLARPVPPTKPERDVAAEVSRTEPAAGVETFESGKGSWDVQFASLRSSEAAQTAWTDLQKSLSVLKPLDHRVERADLGEKGVYYRLKSGPYTEAKARDICAAVTAQKPGGCLVLKH